MQVLEDERNLGEIEAFSAELRCCFKSATRQENRKKSKALHDRLQDISVAFGYLDS